ncbi:periplasmic heavy metal sensor [Pseudophaeobacter sp.]|uniref:periplasmic heavy metal sensor n=1 Tax=Pseudophaeobacter sp. TaxID=1971739 RepID=UPI003298D3AB
MNNEQNTGLRSGMRPWLKVVLVLSLALNLAVIGIGAGAAWRFHGGGHQKDGPPMLGRFIFKDIGRQEVRRLLNDHAGEDGTPRERRRAEMEQVIALVGADTLDLPAVKAVLESHVVETNSFMLSVTRAWEQRLAGLSLNERRELAERMQRRLDHGPRHHRGPAKDR